MGFRFRKSIKIAPGVKLNFNKKSTGITFGGKGFHYTVNSNGKRTKSVGVPGTGLYYTSTSGGGSGSSRNSSGSGAGAGGNYSGGGTSGNGNYYGNNFNAPQGPMYQPTKKNYTLITILLLIFFFPLGLYFMWAKTSWNKVVKIIISVFIGIYCLFFAVAIFSDSDSSTPASSSGITEISCIEDTVRLDLSDPLNEHKTINFDFRTTPGTSDLLNGDFIAVFENDSIADAEVNFIIDYANEVQVTVSALNPGKTTMYIETADGTIRSNRITVEVVGEKTTYSWQTDSATEETTETTTAETTTKETTTRETTTEETTKDNSRTVYITPSGSKYHYSKSCAGDNAMERTLNEVKDAYDPCKKCAQ